MGVAKSIFLMVFLVLGLLATKSTADFQSCYVGCFVLCVIQPQNSAFSCGVNCLKSCIVPTSTLASLRDKDTQYNFCKLGCATSLCTHFSTKENPGGKEVGRCVDSCSETCTRKN